MDIDELNKKVNNVIEWLLNDLPLINYSTKVKLLNRLPFMSYEEVKSLKDDNLVLKINMCD